MHGCYILTSSAPKIAAPDILSSLQAPVQRASGFRKAEVGRLYARVGTKKVGGEMLKHIL
ncbi:hypothetical protein M407DRAFT_19301 [Tulasnella calospora MUT 4182]|uniref:Uncharacterized protein n=1 Tax=Tulasnella calospora MUT 4182 TaxID=1051891 RepID=A0A0C3QID2_9AGAM|nr:hypothetical protein M407DRAFT_19301 [Tulasnella calospora MUT 4182]